MNGIIKTKPKHNPERRAWKGRSHKKGGTRVRDLRERAARERKGGAS
jgi:hypothetical protein